MKVLMYASVASMIDLFNRNNIKILISNHHKVKIACNFIEGNITSTEVIKTFKEWLSSNKVEYIQLPISRNILNISKHYMSIIKTIRLLKSENFDVIHCHSPIGSIILRFSILFMKNKPKIVYTAHGFHFFKGSSFFSWLIYFPLELLLSSLVDILIVINEEDFQISSKFFLAKRIIKLNGIGIDLNIMLDYSLANRRLTLQKFNINLNENDFILCSVGQMSNRKNHIFVIKQLPSLIKMYPNIKYIIAGEGELRGKITSLIKENKLENYVFLLGFTTEAKAIISISNIFIFPSKQEGLPVSLMESLAIGTPVICSKIRGNVDLITDYKNGLLFNLRSKDDFKNKLITLINNYKIFSKTFSENGKLFVQNFSNDKIDLIMADLYKSLM